jgi:hypothetical protein
LPRFEAFQSNINSPKIVMELKMPKVFKDKMIVPEKVLMGPGGYLQKFNLQTIR